MRRLRVSVAGLMVLVLVAGLGLVSLRSASRLWAGSVLLLTLGLLSVAILGVVYRRGARRAFWLGFALLGWGYMILASGYWWDRAADRRDLATTAVLEWLYPHILGNQLAQLPGEIDVRDRLIYQKLDEPITMSFANETPFEDVLKYIKSATQGPHDAGIPIYVDPQGLQDKGKTMQSPVALDVEGVPLRVTLATVVRQLGLKYEVRGGVLMIVGTGTTITDETPIKLSVGMPDENGPADPFLGPVPPPPVPPTPAFADADFQERFLRIGHCYFALVAAWLGGTAGLLFQRTGERRSEP